MGSAGEMEQENDILSIDEIATNLRCSRAHVYNAINGKLAGISRLPAICMGRRRIVRRSSFEAWKILNDGLGQSPLTDRPPTNPEPA
jgi:predicted DNA-binding transcriptional regulator AlpA